MLFRLRIESSLSVESKQIVFIKMERGWEHQDIVPEIVAHQKIILDSIAAKNVTTKTRIENLYKI